MKLLRTLWPVYLAVIVLFGGTTMLGNRMVTVVAERPEVKRQRIFVIDAGHGGEDGGTVSCTGVYESKLNLEVALRLNSLLHLLGHETVLTRTSPDALSTQGDTIAARKLSDLKNRVRLVNSVPGGVLVSIHQNQFPQSRYAGPQVFWGPQQGSKGLACRLQEAMNEGLKIRKGRGAREAGNVYLLRQVRCAAVLIECGFLSNPREEALLRTKEYQLKLCAVTAATLAGAT